MGACSFVLVQIFQLLYYAIYANFEKGDVGVSREGYLGDGVLFLGKYRVKLVVYSIFFITIIYYWLVVYSKCGNANVFSFICLNK